MYADEPIIKWGERSNNGLIVGIALQNKQFHNHIGDITVCIMNASNEPISIPKNWAEQIGFSIFSGEKEVSGGANRGNDVWEGVNRGNAASPDEGKSIVLLPSKTVSETVSSTDGPKGLYRLNSLGPGKYTIMASYFDEKSATHIIAKNKKLSNEEWDSYYTKSGLVSFEIVE